MQKIVLRIKIQNVERTHTWAGFTFSDQETPSLVPGGKQQSLRFLSGQGSHEPAAFKSLVISLTLIVIYDRTLKK